MLPVVYYKTFNNFSPQYFAFKQESKCKHTKTKLQFYVLHEYDFLYYITYICLFLFVAHFAQYLYIHLYPYTLIYYYSLRLRSFRYILQVLSNIYFRSFGNTINCERKYSHMIYCLQTNYLHDKWIIIIHIWHKEESKCSKKLVACLVRHNRLF